MSATVTRVEETVLRKYGDFRNGAGPMWCFGSHTVVRSGDTVYASTVDVEPEARPLCNLRWQLWQRQDGGSWGKIAEQQKAGEREPCPIALGPGGTLLLSANTAVTPSHDNGDGTTGFHCVPQLLSFEVAGGFCAERNVIIPQWNAEYPFSEHSYRGFSSDASGNVFLTHQASDGSEYGQAWCYRTSEGDWVAAGFLRFPMRGCYPAAAVNGKAVAVLAISDEIEPNEEWRSFKKEKTGRDWDYDFRQLFFTWTPDVTAVPFSVPLTIASVDETCGVITHTDLLVTPDGDVHVLYIERNVYHDFVRERFFPDLPLSVSLKYVRLRRGRVVERRILCKSCEKFDNTRAETAVKMGAPVPTWAVFHATGDGRVFLVWNQTDNVASQNGMFLRQIIPQWDTTAISLPVRTPLTQFFAASTRAGCLPDNRLDLYGTAPGEQVIRTIHCVVETDQAEVTR